MVMKISDQSDIHTRYTYGHQSCRRRNSAGDKEVNTKLSDPFVSEIHHRDALAKVVTEFSHFE